MSNQAASGSKGDASQALLRRAHSPTSTARIYNDKIAYRPLLLTPSLHPGLSIDAREARRKRREELRIRKRRKPKPLSAAEKRKLCIYDIPPHEAKYSIYEGLNNMWNGYMREVLGVEQRQGPITVAADGLKLASADYHGAEVEVVRSGCVSRVGLRGIVVRDTKFTFVIITSKDELKTVPKEGTTFKVSVRKSEEDETPCVTFELFGDQMKNRAPERANKRFKPHFTLDV